MSHTDGASVTTTAAGEDGPSLISSLWRYRGLAIALTIIGTVIGYVASSRQPNTYEASATLYLTDDSGGIFDSVARADPERYVQLQASRITTRPVLDRAEELMTEQSQGQLAGDISVGPDPTVGIVSVVAKGNDPQRVANSANAVAAAYTQVTREMRRSDLETANDIIGERIAGLREEIQRLERDLRSDPDDFLTASQMEMLQTELLTLQSRMSELTADAAVFGSGVDLLEQATPPATPTSPRPMRDAVLLGILGGVVGAAIAYWRAGATQSTDASAMPGEILGVPLLGKIPHYRKSGDGELVLDDTTREAYQLLTSSIELSLRHVAAPSVLITSALPREGKSSVALHVSVTYAREGRDVVLLDADVRTKGLSTLLRADDREGLIELLDGRDPTDVIRQYRVSETVRLSFVPAGIGDGIQTGILRTPEVRTALSQLRRSSGLTIIDTAPLLMAADATAIAAQVDGIVIVVDADTGEDDLRMLRDRLKLTSTLMLGYVYNRAPVEAPHQRTTHLSRPRSWMRQLSQGRDRLYVDRSASPGNGRHRGVRAADNPGASGDQALNW